jgi:hypothetical protein
VLQAGGIRQALESTGPGEQPGAGAVTALLLAQVAAVVEMAAMAEPDWSGSTGAVAQAWLLRERALELAERNQARYAAALAALAGAGAPDAPALEPALADSIGPLLAIGETAVDVALLAAEVAAATSRTRADAIAACQLAAGATRAIRVLVDSNLVVATPEDARAERAATLVRRAADAAASCPEP